MSNDTLPDWERVLSAAAHLQRILPGAVLVGGSAAAVYAGPTPQPLPAREGERDIACPPTLITC